MSANTLSSANSYNPGADLWIVTDHRFSRWTEKIDWHLNFQISKSLRHISSKTSPFLNFVLKNTELPNFDFLPESKSQLLIASNRLLPNRWVLVLGFDESLDIWMNDLTKVWKKLGDPSLRIFVPSPFNVSKVAEFWNNHHSTYDVSLVAEP